MSGHRIDWFFDNDYASPELVCEEPPGADCRLTNAGCDCESIKLERDQDGTPYHMVEDARHEMTTQEECNVILFLEEDTADHAEQGQRFLIGSHEIEPVWGGDYYEWRRKGTS